MSFLKKHLQLIVFAVVCVAACGAAGWGYLAGGEILDEMQAVNSLANDLKRQRSSPENLDTIAAKKKKIEQENKKLERALEEALATQKINAFDGQPRKLLVPDVLPKPKSNADALDFKDAYLRAFKELLKRLRGRDRPSTQEIAEQRAFIENKVRSADSRPKGPWMPEVPTVDGASEKGQKGKTLAEVLKQSAEARAAEIVSRSIYMYVDRGAIRPQRMLLRDNVPNAIQIWHAQMTLWIQEDIITALARVNEQRAKELLAAGRKEDVWVAHMPVKRLKVLRIRGWLGKGGGSNQGRFAKTFTGQKNDKSKFIVPLQLELVVEEASLMKVLQSLSEVGFYVPIGVTYQQAEIDPLQRKYIYGEDPVLDVTIDLEAYYLRKVFDQWIPKSLKPILSTPEAKETNKGRR